MVVCKGPVGTTSVAQMGALNMTSSSAVVNYKHNSKGASNWAGPLSEEYTVQVQSLIG